MLPLTRSEGCSSPAFGLAAVDLPESPPNFLQPAFAPSSSSQVGWFHSPRLRRLDRTVVDPHKRSIRARLVMMFGVMSEEDTARPRRWTLRVAAKGRLSQSRRYKIALVMFALFGVGDLLSLVRTDGRAAPPVVLLVIWSVLGIITLVGLPFAWRGAHKALIAVVISQVLSAVLRLPVVFMDKVTDFDPVSATAGVILTAVAVVLLYPAWEEADKRAE